MIISRRNFLKASAALGSGLTLLGSLLALKVEGQPRTPQERGVTKIEPPGRIWEGGEVATPYLKISNLSHHFYMSSNVYKSFPLKVSVSNEGNSSSYFTTIELLESSAETILQNDIKNCEIIDRKIITLHPGEEKKVELLFERKFLKGQVVCICYDPFYDPKTFPYGIGFGNTDRKNILLGHLLDDIQEPPRTFPLDNIQ